MGQGICIDDGSANKKKKDLIELLAFQVNRIRYFTECRLKAAEVHRNAIDRALSGIFLVSYVLMPFSLKSPLIRICCRTDI